MNPKIYIEADDLFYNKIKWVVTLLGKFSNTEYDFVKEQSSADLKIGTRPDDDIIIDHTFFINIENGNTHWKQILPVGPIYKNKEGQESALETIFYHVNCIQELNPTSGDLDHWGRYRYEASLQHHYGIIEKNVVGEIMDKMLLKFPQLAGNKTNRKFPKEVFLSHDIDILHDGWKIEAYLAAKNLNPLKLAKVLYDKILGRPFYNNIGKILELDSKYGMTSCFYWLLNRGKDSIGIKNADYSAEDVHKLAEKCSRAGFENGIHKSTFESSFEEEMDKAPFEATHNRYHFLKFRTHEAWEEMQQAGIKTDASLGFAGHIGFRNGYGLPFTPFDLKNDKPYSFVVMPLHVMDGILTNYMGIQPKDVFDRVVNFLSAQQYGAIPTILWHNNELTDYSFRVMHQTYENLLSWMQSNGITSTSADAMYTRFRIVNF